MQVGRSFKNMVVRIELINGVIDRILGLTRTLLSTTNLVGDSADELNLCFMGLNLSNLKLKNISEITAVAISELDEIKTKTEELLNLLDDIIDKNQDDVLDIITVNDYQKQSSLFKKQFATLYNDLTGADKKKTAKPVKKEKAAEVVKPNIAVVDVAKSDIEHLEVAEKFYQEGKISEALENFAKAAALGNIIAMYNIGLIYHNGQYIPQDFEKAIKWYRASASLGNELAMYNIGIMFENGQFVPQDSQQALKWYEMSGELGNGQAYYNIGCLYDEGVGNVSQNYELALQWYLKSAELRCSTAMFNIAVIYQLGHGVPVNIPKALEWYENSSNLYYAPAMSNIGIIYFNGTEVDKDLDLALYWFERSKEAGNYAAMKYINKIQKSSNNSSTKDLTQLNQQNQAVVNETNKTEKWWENELSDEEGVEMSAGTIMP